MGLTNVSSLLLSTTGMKSQKPHILSRVEMESVNPSGSIAGDVICRVNGVKIDPVKFSLGLIAKIFPPGVEVLLNDDGGFDLPEGEVISYSTKRSRHSGDRLGFVEIARHKRSTRQADIIRERIYTDKRPNNGNGNTAELKIPRAKLFEIHVTGDLYTYILAFLDGNYIRTPLMKKVKVS